MKSVVRLSTALLSAIAALSLACADPERVSDPRSALSLDRSTAPGLDQACSDKPGLHLARRPNAPLELLCAFTLPSGSNPILNGTKSWVDGGRYYLTELKNASVYIFDAVGAHAYVGRVTGFVGATLNTDGTTNAARSGPNSITFTGDGRAWVSDGISAVQVVDLSSRSIIATIGTAIAACDNGTTVHNCQRTNEITYDPEHQIVFVQNPSPLGVTSGTAIDTYGTFISSVPPYAVLGTITFPNRQGQEAPLWDPDQHRILTAVSGRQTVSSGVVTAVFQQYVAVIDPTVRPFTVEKHYDIDCTALGLVGPVTVTPPNPTGRIFGINDPALGPDGHMVIPGCGRALIMDARTGAITIMPVGGGNETSYNSGDGNFYVTGADFSATPAGPNSLGVIDARSSRMLQLVPAVRSTNPAAAAENNIIFAVVSAATADTAVSACTQFGSKATGCILVFAHVPGNE